jgi:tetratricopeptide (TPR) repeat protein
MLLQHFSNMLRHAGSMRHLTPLILCAIVLSGCASGPNRAQTGSSQEQAAAEGRRWAGPANALTLFAELRFKEFLLQYPEYPGAHVNLAIISARAGDDKAAEGHIVDALIIDPEHAAALNQLGMLLRRQGKFIEAEAAYLKAVTASPDYALAHYNLGVLNELYLQRLDAALQHFERYQEIEGEDRQVTKWIADLRRRLDAQQRTAKVAE